MPGLIDAHIHVVLTEVNLRLLADVPLTLLAAKGSVAMRAMLHRGFTTLRDTGGADYGIKAAVEQGLFEGPRLFIAGQPLSQTGGHGERRLRTESESFCACCSGLSWTGAHRRRRARSDQGDARRTAQGRRPHQDHGVGRRRLAGRSAGEPAIPRGRDRGRGGRGDALGHLCLRPRLFGEGDRARGDRRRAHDRARQPDRCADRAAHGRARRVSGADAGRLRRAEAPRPGLRTVRLQPGEERTGAACRACARWRSPAPPG